jgi:hypothetical protein
MATRDRKAYAKAWRKSERGQELYRENHLNRKYGITNAQYNELYKEQGGRCACCGKHQMEQKWSLDVDHDHKGHGIESVRGLLCRDCNLGIGKLGDKLEDVQNALDYLVAFRDSVDHSKEPGTRG